MEQKEVGKEQDRVRERKRGDGLRVRGGVWQRKGCGMGHKLDCWLSIYEDLEKGLSESLSRWQKGLSQEIPMVNFSKCYNFSSI